MSPIVVEGAGWLQKHMALGHGRPKPLRLRSNESMFFEFAPEQDGFCALGIEMWFVRSKKNRSENSCPMKLQLFASDSPSLCREANLVLQHSKLKAVEYFEFEPITDSKQKNFTVVLHAPEIMGSILVYCSRVRDRAVVLGSRGKKDFYPAIIPYYNSCVGNNPVRPKRLISVLIVTYNSAMYIRGCLDSIYNQTYKNFEIVVVDNASKDETVSIVKSGYPAVKLLDEKSNLHFCKANNFGLCECGGEFIYVMNADVVLKDTAIQHMLDCIDMSEHVGIVGTCISTKGSISRYADTFLLNRKIANHGALLARECFIASPCGASFLIRRSVIDELGYLFDERFLSDWEDHDLGLRCWLHGYICLHIPSIEVWHFGAGAYGFINPKRDTRIMRNQLLTYFKSYSLPEFFVTLAKVIKGIRTPYEFLGLLKFVVSCWKFIPERTILQRKRKIHSRFLNFITSGVQAFKSNIEL